MKKINESIGSLRGLLNKKPKTSKIRTQEPLNQVIKESDQNKPLENHSNDEDKKQIALPNESNTRKKNDLDLIDSKHKEIVNEVPQWNKMTINEAATLLSKHICYFNVERKLTI